MGRAVGQKLGEALGQTFVVDNRPGAAGIIGTDAVAATPREIVQRLSAETIKALAAPDLRARFASLGAAARGPGVKLG